MGMRRLTIEKKRAFTGVLLISPWLVGLILFFLYPLISELVYSFRNVSFQPGGGLSIAPLKEGIWSNYLRAFTKDPDFLQKFWDSLRQMVLLSPCIVIFALFMAAVLNQKFRGRLLMRALFFLPVIIATGLISEIIRQSLTDVARGGSAEANLFNSTVLAQLMIESGLPSALVNFLTGLINNIVDLVWKSGIQILIFLAGLLSISSTYYEVAQVEGATAWESFWKITFPLISPYILVNLVYTVVDSFTSYDNQVMRYIVSVNYTNINFSYAAALYWLYFAVVLVLIAILYGVASRRIHYEA